MSNVVDLVAWRARRRPRPADGCLEPECNDQAVWYTTDGQPVACEHHNPPIPAPLAPEPTAWDRPRVTVVG